MVDVARRYRVQAWANMYRIRPLVTVLPNIRSFLSMDTANIVLSGNIIVFLHISDIHISVHDKKRTEDFRHLCSDVIPVYSFEFSNCTITNPMNVVDD